MPDPVAVREDTPLTAVVGTPGIQTAEQLFGATETAELTLGVVLTTGKRAQDEKQPEPPALIS